MTARIALTMRVTEEAGYTERRDSISHDWLDRLASWDMAAVPIPNIQPDPEGYLDAISPDLLVLTGGGDPGETPERDAMEERLLRHAVSRELPLLGVCRGMQVMNLHFGGSLVAVDGHVANPHDVAIEAQWSEIYGARCSVNSFHNRGIEERGLAPELVAAAHDADGHVEALHHATHPLAGVMWHPERGGAPEQDRQLIERLLSGGIFRT